MRDQTDFTVQRTESSAVALCLGHTHQRLLTIAADTRWRGLSSTRRRDRSLTDIVNRICAKDGVCGIPLAELRQCEGDKRSLRASSMRSGEAEP